MAKPKKPVVRNALVQKNKRARTMRNKIARLATKVRKNPTDISADIALSQAMYDLGIGNY